MMLKNSKISVNCFITIYQIFNICKGNTMYRYNKLLAKFSIITLLFVCHHVNALQFVTVKSKVNSKANSLEWAKQAISVEDCEYLAVFERSNSVFLQGGI